MRDGPRFLHHTAVSITKHQITQRAFRSAGAQLTDEEEGGRAPHIPRNKPSVLAPVGAFRANHDMAPPPAMPPAQTPDPREFGLSRVPTVTEDWAIASAYGQAPQTLFRGPAGRELRRQMNRANPRGRQQTWSVRDRNTVLDPATPSWVDPPSIPRSGRLGGHVWAAAATAKPAEPRRIEARPISREDGRAAALEHGRQRDARLKAEVKQRVERRRADLDALNAARAKLDGWLDPPEISLDADATRDQLMVRVGPSVALDDVVDAAAAAEAPAPAFVSLFAPAPAPDEFAPALADEDDWLAPPETDFREIEGILDTSVRALPTGAYDRGEREALRAVLKAPAASRLVGLGVHLVYWSFVRPGGRDAARHETLYGECLSSFGHVKTDLVATARRRRVRDVRVNGALLPVVVLAVKRSVEDILMQAYEYLELAEGQALLSAGLALLSEILDPGAFNAPTRMKTFDGTVAHVRDDGEYDISLDAGGTETHVPARLLRRRTGPPVETVPLVLGEAVEVHSDKHKVPELAHHRAVRISGRYWATSAAATALYTDSLAPTTRMLARPKSRYRPRSNSPEAQGALPQTPGSVSAEMRVGVYRDFAASVGYADTRPRAFPRKDDKTLARLKHKYRDLLSDKPDYTPHTRGQGREEKAYWSVANHAYQERRHNTPFNWTR